MNLYWITVLCFSFLFIFYIRLVVDVFVVVFFDLFQIAIMLVSCVVSVSPHALSFSTTQQERKNNNGDERFLIV